MAHHVQGFIPKAENTTSSKYVCIANWYCLCFCLWACHHEKFIWGLIPEVMEKTPATSTTRTGGSKQSENTSYAL